MNRICRSLSIVALILTATVARAADWPTYLNGNDRVGATTTQLKLPLALRREYTSPAPPEISPSATRASSSARLDGRVLDSHQALARSKKAGSAGCICVVLKSFRMNRGS